MPYNTLEEANGYFLARYGFSKWEPLTEPTKLAVLTSANQHLDLLCSWNGTKTDPDQASEFPRNGETVVDNKIKYAECEIAYLIIENESLSTVSDDPLEELKAGPVSFKFKTGVKPGNPLVNDLTKTLLKQFGICDFNMSGGSSRSIPIFRG